jgi:hypothetical protein
MKASKISALLAMAVLFVSTSAFAAANKASIVLGDNTVVGGKTLPGGDYTVKWEGQGQNVNLSIVKGKKVVAETSARLIDLSKAADGSSIQTKTNPDGTRTLSRIQFGGKKFSLELGEPTSQTDVASKVK